MAGEYVYQQHGGHLLLDEVVKRLEQQCPTFVRQAGIPTALLRFCNGKKLNKRYNWMRGVNKRKSLLHMYKKLSEWRLET